MKETSEEEERENAALKIQAAFRGYLAREEVKKMKSGEAQEEKREENEWEDWFYSPAPQGGKKKKTTHEQTIQIHQPRCDCCFFS